MGVRGGSGRGGSKDRSKVNMSLTEKKVSENRGRGKVGKVKD